MGSARKARPSRGPEPTVEAERTRSGETSSEQPGTPRGPRSRGSGIPAQLVEELPTASEAAVPGSALERTIWNPGFPTLTEGSPPAVARMGTVPPEPGQPAPNRLEPAGIPAKE